MRTLAVWGREARALGLDGRGGYDSTSPAKSGVPAPLDELGCFPIIQQVFMGTGPGARARACEQD